MYYKCNLILIKFKDLIIPNGISRSLILCLKISTFKYNTINFRF